MRFDVVSKSIDRVYYAMLATLVSDGKVLSPRGVSTREIRACSITIENPSPGYLVSKSRGLNPFFASAELAWILAGSNSLGFIEKFNKSWSKFSDDGTTLHGAYGARMRSQLDHIVNLLSNDPYSRQAVISIWNESDRASTKTKDRPCNTQLQFYRDHEGRLGLIVTVRSQDIVYGFPYDTFNWTMLQKMVASSLSWPIGEYRANFGSLHLYESHVDWAFEMLDAHDFSSLEIPVFDLDSARGIAMHLVDRFTIAFESGIESLPDELRYLRFYHKHVLDPAFMPMVVKALEVLRGTKDSDAYTFLSHGYWGPAVYAWLHRTRQIRPNVKAPEASGG